MTKKIRLYQPFGDPGCQRPEIMMMLMKQEDGSEEKSEEKTENGSEE